MSGCRENDKRDVRNFGIGQGMLPLFGTAHFQTVQIANGIATTDALNRYLRSRCFYSRILANRAASGGRFKRDHSQQDSHHPCPALGFQLLCRRGKAGIGLVIGFKHRIIHLGFVDQMTAQISLTEAGPGFIIGI